MAEPSAGPSEVPSWPPSGPPSASPSDNPTIYVASLSPSSAPSHEPSLDPTSTARPTALPSAPPSRAGDLQGPTTTERLVVNIRGIEAIEDEEAWSAATSEYIMEFFNATGDDEGAFDVTVSIEVTNQTGSARALSGLRRGPTERRDDGREERRRHLQSSITTNVEVTYEQTSSYRTTNPFEYDDKYVAIKPLQSQRGVEDYVRALRGLSPHYDGVASVGSVMVDPLPPGTRPGGGVGGVAAGDGDGGSGAPSAVIPTVIAVVCGAALLIAVIIIAVLRKRKKHREEYVDSDDSDDPDDADDSDNDGLGWVGYLASDGRGRDPSQESAPAPPSRSRSRSKSRNRGYSSSLVDIPEDGEPASGSAIHVVAPAGELGVLVDDPAGGGPPRVCEVKDASPVAGRIRLDDRIVAVDDEDVREVGAAVVSRMLATRSRQAERKITLLREDGGRRSSGRRSSVDTSDSSEDGYEDIEETGGHGGHYGGHVAGGSSGWTEVNTVPSKEDNREMLDVFAPAGKLGVILVSPEPPEPPGPPYVFSIMSDSPLKGKARLEDKIIAVDDEDVRKLTAISVSQLLGMKSSNARRKITILRENGGANDDDGILT